MSQQVFGAPVRRVIHMGQATPVQEPPRHAIVVKKEDDPFVRPNQPTLIRNYQPIVYTEASNSSASYFDDIPVEDEYEEEIIGDDEETLELIEDGSHLYSEKRESSPVIDVGLPHEHYSYVEEQQQYAPPRIVTYGHSNPSQSYCHRVQSQYPDQPHRSQQKEGLTIVYRPQESFRPQQPVTQSERTKRIYKCTSCQFETLSVTTIAHHADKCGKLHYGRGEPNRSSLRFMGQGVKESSLRFSFTEQPIQKLIHHPKYLPTDCFICFRCPFVCRSSHKLKKHIQWHVRSTGNFFCQKCDYKHTNQERITKHDKLHRRDDSDRQNLMRMRQQKLIETVSKSQKGHLAILAHPLKFACSLCKETFTSQAQRAAHRIIHEKYRNPIARKSRGKWRCTVCGVHLRSNLSRLVHKIRAHRSHGYRSKFSHQLIEIRKNRLLGKEENGIHFRKQVFDGDGTDSTCGPKIIKLMRNPVGIPVSQRHQNQIIVRMQQQYTPRILNERRPSAGTHIIRKELTDDDLKPGSQDLFPSHDQLLRYHPPIDKAALALSEIPPLPPMAPDGGRVLKDVAVLLPCKECPYVAGCPGNLRLHERHHYAPKEEWTEKCDLCSFKCKGVAHIRRHMRAHENPALVQRRVQYEKRLRQIYEDDESALPPDTFMIPKGDGAPSNDHDDVTGSSNAKTTTNARHVNPRRVKCSKCPYRTRFNYDLQQHEKHHGDPLQPYQCLHCDYGSKSQHHLMKHISLHVHEDEYSSTSEFSTPFPSPRKYQRRSNTASKNPSPTKPQESPLAKHSAKVTPVKEPTPKPSPNKKRKLKISAEPQPSPPKLKKPNILGGLDKGKPVYARNISAPIGREHRLGKQGNLYTCTSCPYDCRKLSSLCEHARLHQGSREFKCALCTYSSKSADKLADHQLLHRKGLGDSADGSGAFAHRHSQSFQHSLALKRLAKMTPEELREQAADGDITTAEEIEIQTEAKRLANLKEYDVISPSADRRATLRKYSTGKSVVLNGGVSCTHCPYSTTDPTALANHVTHHASTGKQLPFLCPHCSYSTSLADDMRAHIAVHEKDGKKRAIIMAHSEFARRSARRKIATTPTQSFDGLPRLRCRHEDCHFTCTSGNRLVEHQHQYHDARVQWALVSRQRHKKPAEKHTRKLQRRIASIVKKQDDSDVLDTIEKYEDSSVVNKIVKAMINAGKDDNSNEPHHGAYKVLWTATEDTAAKAQLQEVHNCTKCSFQCTQKYLFAQHCALHNSANQQKFACNLCDYRSDKQDVVDFHELYHHTTLPLDIVASKVAFKS